MEKQAQTKTRRDARKIGTKDCVKVHLNVCASNYKRQVIFRVLSFRKEIEFDKRANKYSSNSILIIYYITYNITLYYV